MSEVIEIDSINKTAKTLTLKTGLAHTYAVNDVIYHRGRSELDLMKLVIAKPAGLGTGKVKLEKLGTGSFKVWKHSTKREKFFDEADVEIALPVEFDATQFDTENKIVLWVEATGVSTALRDIQLKLSFGTLEPDVVKATAMWVELKVIDPSYPLGGMYYTRQQTDGFPDNPVPGVDFPDLDNPLKGTINDTVRSKDGSRYGFGTQRKNATTGEDTWRGGRILLELEVEPQFADLIGTHSPAAGFAMPSFVETKLDITRQTEIRLLHLVNGHAQFANPISFNRNYPVSGGLIPGASFPLDPRDVETPNDDGANTDEDNDPGSGTTYTGTVYSFDGPSFDMTATVDGNLLAYRVMRGNFLEWTRIKIKTGGVNVDFNNKNLEVEGSRCSQPVPWYVQNYARRASDGKFVDDTGATSNSTPVFTGAGTKGTIELTLGSSATTEGFMATYALGTTTWTLKRKSDGMTFSKGGMSPWTITVSGTLTVKITQDATTPFGNGDKYEFSVFKTTSTIGKKNEVSEGQSTVVDGP